MLDICCSKQCVLLLVHQLYIFFPVGIWRINGAISIYIKMEVCLFQYKTLFQDLYFVLLTNYSDKERMSSGSIACIKGGG